MSTLGSIALRPYQDKMVDETRLAFRSGHNEVLLQLATGGGKCLGRGTPVMLFDGRVKPVEDIVPGDLLMGPDSTPRRVLSTCQGREPLYRVVPKKGDPYIVNESHILSLKMTRGVSTATPNPGRRGGLFSGKVVNIGVLDYLASTKTFRHRAKGWRVAVDFPAHEEPLRLEPYFLGLWLGDGNSNGPAVCIGDPETSEYLHDFADRLGMRTRVKYNSVGSDMLFLVERDGPGNRVTMALRQDGVLNNKHIPLRYKTASRVERLALMAGLMDSDGSWTGKGYDLSLKSERLMDDVVFLARSLGFSASKVATKKTCTNNGVEGDYFRCCISGDVDAIPCLIARKKAAPRRQKKDPLMVGISVEPMGEGDYFGFEIDGDHLFLLGDFTVTHNTLTAGYILGSAAEKGNTGWFICNRVELVDQTMKAFDRLGIRYGVIAAGVTPNYYSKVQICSVNTLQNRLKAGAVKPPRLAVWDECRSIAAAGWAAIHATLRAGGVTKQLGLDATPVRLDGQPLLPFFSHMVRGPAYSELQALGNLVPFDCYLPSIGGPNLAGVRTEMGDYEKKTLEAVMDQPTIVGDMVEHYLRHTPGKLGITFAVSRKHSEHLAEAYRARGVRAHHLDGDTDKGERKRMVAAFRRREIEMLTNVDLFTAGFDVPGVEVIVDGAPTKSLSKALQKWGRGSRPDEENPAKDRCYLLDAAGNVLAHGLPDSDRDWSLEGRPKKKKGEPSAPVLIRQCENCFAAFWPPPICRYCGHEHEVQSREVARVAGTLEKLSPEALEALRLAKSKEVKKARTLAEFKEIEKARGYSEGWAEHQMASRAAAAQRYKDKFAQQRAEDQYKAYGR